MAMRLQELHPALVHFPISMLPTTLAIDAAGRLIGDATLLEIGRRGIGVVAGSAAVSAVAGLLAQEASHFDEDTRDILITHRNLNLGVIGLTGWMAVRRLRQERPGIGYLIAGIAGVAVMAYSAYLGGHMVYERGVGVSRAEGLRESEAPALLPSTAGEVLNTSARHVVQGMKHAAEDLARGEVVPWLTRSSSPNGGPHGAGQPSLEQTS